MDLNNHFTFHYDTQLDSQTQLGDSSTQVSTIPRTQDIERLIGIHYDFQDDDPFEYTPNITHTSTTLYPYYETFQSQVEDTSLIPGPGQSTLHSNNPPPSHAHLPPPWAPTPYRRLVPTLPGPAPLPLTDEEKINLIQARTAEAYLKLYKHGALFRRPGETGCWELGCPAGCWVKTSIILRNPLDSAGHFSALVSHAHGQNCAANSKKPQASVPRSAACTPAVTRGNTPAQLGPLERPQNTCPGLAILHLWPTVPGIPVMTRFPWLRTRDGPDKLPFDVELVKGILYARSFDCPTEYTLEQPCCDGCRLLLPKALNIAQNAGEFSIHTRHNLLTPVQHLEVIKRLTRQCNELKLQSLNYQRRIVHLVSTLSDHSSLIMALSQCDVPYLRQLLHTALKNGASVRAILRHLEGAIEHGYRPRGHKQESLDLALLIYRLGGRSLLYAMTQRFPIPSLRTLRNHFSFLKVAPTIGRINSTSVQQNLQTLLIASRNPNSPRRGASLMIDETALEETAVYFTDVNAVGGLCWLHAHQVDCTLRTYQSALNIVEALHDGRVHLAKEVSVVAIRLFGEDGIFPILATPTCKHETASDMEYVFKTVIETYTSSGADSVIGPLWSLATDGDATRRKAGHKLLMASPIPISDPLFGILSNLPGLDIKTGPHLITLDPDFKHTLKRLSTAIRSRSGIYINGQSINTFLLERYLVWLDGLDENAVQRLLHPDDPQDVPRAVELLSAIKNLSRIDPRQPPFTPCGSIPNAGVISDFHTLSLLGHIIESFLEPYINVSFSLSEQITSLSRLAHILFACYHDQRRRFIPNQLYYDIQSMIKTAVFNVAKQQLLDPEAVFALVELGDDSLELLFAFLRMCGAHNSAFNYRQVIDRLGSAQDISSVHSRNPDLHHGHRRLNFKRTESVDHITRSSWAGDIISGHCDLPSCWRKGRDEALSILEQTKLPASTYDFQNLFRQGSGPSGSDVNLLSVFGHGRYPSIEEAEDEEVDSVPQATRVPNTQAGSSLGPAANDTDSDQTLVPLRSEVTRTSMAQMEDEEEPPLTFEEAVIEELRDSSSDEDPLAKDSENLNVRDDIPSHPPTGPGVHSADYLWCEKRWIHKQSVCRIIISPDFTPKSFDRLMRVRGYTHVHKVATSSMENTLRGDRVLVGDLFVTFVRTQDKQLALALVRATAISESGAPRSSIGLATVCSPRGNVKLSGDIMALVPSKSSLAGHESAWVWNGSFVSVTSNGPDSGDRIASITVPGYLTDIVNPEIADGTLHLGTNDQERTSSNSTTWLIDNDAVELLISGLWKKVLDQKTPLSTIPGLSGGSCTFPYQNGESEFENLNYALHSSDLEAHLLPARLICFEGTEQLGVTRGKAPVNKCPVCGDTNVTDLRSHMGTHVLRAARGVFEPGVMDQPITGTLPCGFCGRTGEPECALQVKHLSRGTQWETKCPRKEKFQYASAERGSDNRPCRNVPISCGLCIHSGRATDERAGIWRYNMEAHLDYQHPEYSHPGKLEASGTPLPRHVFNSMYISEREERWASVPIRAPFTNIAEEETQQNGTNARTRKRKNDAETFATAAGMSKRSRTSLN